ncbi:hypothetical protein J6590_038524 [Homalodisca vitripennis]|nr:hypothetical protein J6590_038524 [Homalodisca vitripennis]
MSPVTKADEYSPLQQPLYSSPYCCVLIGTAITGGGASAFQISPAILRRTRCIGHWSWSRYGSLSVPGSCLLFRSRYKIMVTRWLGARVTARVDTGLPTPGPDCDTATVSITGDLPTSSSEHREQGRAQHVLVSMPIWYSACVEV